MGEVSELECNIDLERDIVLFNFRLLFSSFEQTEAKGA